MLQKTQTVEKPQKSQGKQPKSKQSQISKGPESPDEVTYSNIDKFPLISTTPLPSKLKVIAHNMNGLRSALTKNISEYLQNENPDIVFIGETKIGFKVLPEFLESQSFQNSFLGQHYNYMFACSSLKQGYASTACFVKNEYPIENLQNKLIEAGENNIINSEGRYIQLDLENNLTFIHVYVPNVGRNQYNIMQTRIKFEENIRQQINKLQQQQRHVIYCGDLNVIDQEIDIFDWKGNLGNPGMTEEERAELQKLKAQCSLIDTFRYKNPELIKYSWFSNFGKARQLKHGWRIDYFFVSQSLVNNVVSSEIIDEKCDYSDHVPIILQLQL